MTPDLRPYPEYRESGVPWLGAIPAHWDVRRCKYLFREVDERSDKGEETHLSMSQKHGLIPSRDLGGRRLHSESYAGGKLCETNDLVLNRLKAHLGVFAMARQPGVISPDYTVLRPICDGNPEFFMHVFKTPSCTAELRCSTKGIVEGFWRLYTDDFYNVRVPVPALDERETILRFIRSLDARVRRFIRNRRRLIEVLNEQKQAIIERAFTRGLDPGVRLKPSGIDWLGDVPQHWELRRLKYLVQNINEQTSSLRNGDLYVALEHVESWTGRLALPDGEVSFDSQVKRFRGGDILFGKLRPYLAKVTQPQQAGVCVGEFLVLRPSDATILPSFLEQKLRSKQIIDLVNSSTFGAKMPRADWTFIGNVQIAFSPKHDEQAMILNRIARETATLTSAIERIQCEIALVQEYRTRLIADVVTGKVDVRHLAPDAVEAAVEEPEEWEEAEDMIDGQDAGDLEAVEEMADADD